jgi:hypothetical protein
MACLSGHPHPGRCGAAGRVKTYKRVKAAYPEKVTLNMLWGLQAALLDLSWNELPQDIKEELRKQVEEI